MIEEGSDNVFRDLGYPNAEEMIFKAELIRQINALIKRKRLTQKEAARRLDTQQARISDLKHGKLSGFSTERLLHFLRLLNCELELRVHPRKHPTRQGPRMRVRMVAR